MIYLNLVASNEHCPQRWERWQMLELAIRTTNKTCAGLSRLWRTEQRKTSMVQINRGYYAVQKRAPLMSRKVTKDEITRLFATELGYLRTGS